MAVHRLTLPDGTVWVYCEECGVWYSQAKPCGCADPLEKIRKKSLVGR